MDEASVLSFQKCHTLSAQLGTGLRWWIGGSISVKKRRSSGRMALRWCHVQTAVNSQEDSCRLRAKSSVKRFPSMFGSTDQYRWMKPERIYITGLQSKPYALGGIRSGGRFRPNYKDGENVCELDHLPKMTEKTPEKCNVPISGYTPRVVR